MVVHVVPALMDFHTPPDADPTTTCAKSDSSASMEEMRPIRLALPTFRHLRSRTIGSPAATFDCAVSVAATSAATPALSKQTRPRTRALITNLRGKRALSSYRSAQDLTGQMGRSATGPSFDANPMALLGGQPSPV